MPQPPITTRIQPPAPAALPAPSIITLPIARLRPVLRIAHRWAGKWTSPERIILDHQLMLMNGGSCRFRTRSQEITLRAGHLLFLQPFVPHSFAGGEPFDHTAVHFDLAPDVPRHAANPERRKPYQVRFAEGYAIPLHRVTSAADGIKAALNRLAIAWHVDGIGQLVAHAELFSVLSRLLSRSEPADADASGVSRAHALIAERYAEPLTIGDLARAAGLSASRFRHAFRAWSGYAPMEHLRRVRVARARDLLLDPSLSIRTVAALVGFDDQYHFSRVFRSIDGMSPSGYRGAVLAGRAVPKT